MYPAGICDEYLRHLPRLFRFLFLFNIFLLSELLLVLHYVTITEDRFHGSPVHQLASSFGFDPNRDPDVDPDCFGGAGEEEFPFTFPIELH